MVAPTAETYPRPDELTQPADPSDPAALIFAVLYARSYLLIRMIVGIIGLALPAALIAGEALYLRGGVHVRGSLSAYYHTSMRDIFVAGLCVTGFLLATYMAGQANREFWSSLVAGLAVFGVVFFPTQRPHLLPGAPRCGTTPMPEGCSPIQQQLGETLVARIHFAFAAIFILSLAWICIFLFAHREKDYKHSPGMAAVMYACGWIIVAAVAWTIVGRFLNATVWELTPLYVGEVVSVLAFGVAWLLKSRDLWGALGHAVNASPSDTRQRQGRGPAEEPQLGNVP